MNLLGKILTLLIFLMSVCFLVISVMVGATHRKWKEEAGRYERDAAAAAAVAQDAKSKTGEKEKLLASERVARAMQIAQLESLRNAAESALKIKEKQLSDEQITNKEHLRRLNQAEDRLAEQDAEVANLKARNVKLAADVADKYNLVRSLQNDINETSNQLNAIKDLNGDLTANLAQKQKVMRANGLSDDALVDHIVPKLDGLVTQTSATSDLVAFGLGTDDGLRVGHVMDVYRDRRFIGKVTIVKSDFDVSVARPNKDFMNDTIQEGDHVTSRF